MNLAENGGGPSRIFFHNRYRIVQFRTNFGEKTYLKDSAFLEICVMQASSEIQIN